MKTSSKSGRKNRPYELQVYDPKWPEMFEARKAKLTPLFGDNLISIEHIGSTSIHGMFAKPNIDMLVVVKDLEVIPTQYQTFIDGGYTPRGREYVGGGDEYLTEDAEDGTRITSIHVLEEGNPKIQEYREFRDYLNINEEDKQRYINLKKDLYEKHRDDYSAYDSGKSKTIAAINARAKDWAEENL